MFSKGTRYEKTQSFRKREDGSEVFGGIRPRVIDTAKGVIEHTISSGDRLDLLARHYYNNDRLWWRIIDANPEFIYSGDLELDTMAGEIILIPRTGK